MQVETALESQTLYATREVWPPLSRVAFRFCFVYFTLYCLGTQIINSVLAVPKIEVPDWGTLWPVRPLIFWVGGHVFGAKLPLVYSGSGSGDKNYDWELLFCIMVFACVVTVVWSLLDRKPRDYSTVRNWFWLFLRLCLGSQMLTYGFIKAFPLQMHFPFLSVLIEPFGNFSPSSVLWFSVGAEPAYETIAGCAELLGGFLLILPRTVTLGALICLADMAMVFVLNMTYDVPVKLLSFHLIAISLLLLSGDFSRLANFFFLNHPVDPPRVMPLFTGRRAQRIASSILAFLWLWMIAVNLYGVWDAWHQYGPSAPKSPLYGIWNIESCSVDGKPQPLLVTEPQAWRRVLFEYPNFFEVQRMDESQKGYNLALDQKHNTLTLTDGADKNWKAAFTFVRSAPDRLTLDGAITGHKTTLELRRIDEKKLELLSRGFHWVQDYPYYR